MIIRLLHYNGKLEIDEDKFEGRLVDIEHAFLNRSMVRLKNTSILDLSKFYGFQITDKKTSYLDMLPGKNSSKKKETKKKTKKSESKKSESSQGGFARAADSIIEEYG